MSESGGALDTSDGIPYEIFAVERKPDPDYRRVQVPVFWAHGPDSPPVTLVPAATT